jgi:hypothetical protein
MARYREAEKETAYKIRNMKHNFEKKAATEKRGNTVGGTGVAYNCISALTYNAILEMFYKHF